MQLTKSLDFPLQHDQGLRCSDEAPHEVGSEWRPTNLQTGPGSNRQMRSIHHLPCTLERLDTDGQTADASDRCGHNTPCWISGRISFPQSGIVRSTSTSTFVALPPLELAVEWWAAAVACCCASCCCSRSLASSRLCRILVMVGWQSLHWLSIRIRQTRVMVSRSNRILSPTVSSIEAAS